MLYLIQLYNLCDNELFIDLFDDLSFELQEMGYKDCPDQLVADILFNHFGIEMTDEKQLKSLTQTILKYQNRLSILKSLKHI